MMKKISKIIIIITIIFSIKITECNAAAGINVQYVDNGSNKTEESGPNYNNTWTSGNITYTCTGTYKIDVGYGTTIYGYNQNNEEIINGVPITGENIMAGTAIGLKILETKKISWQKPTISLTKVEKYDTYLCNCKKTVRECNDFGMLMGRFKLPFLVVNLPICKDKEESCTAGTQGCKCETCGGGQSVPKPITSGPEYDACEKAVNAQIQSDAQAYQGSSYALKLRNSNDIQENGIDKTINGSGGCGGTNPITCTYTYAPKTVCMNILTSKVTYRDNDTCVSGEVKIENDSDSNHWHYFTPLNTKSNDDFVLTMSYASQSGLQEKGFCVQAIDSNPTNYKSFVRDKNNQKLTGMTIEKDKETVTNGCYFGTEIDINIEQKFYNEINQEQLKGFNFYYKPIEINNPFPNGISGTSLWKNWYESENKKPNISDSYSTITYKALNINANAIRNYNNIDINPQDGISDNLYGDWTKMNIDGTSQYIDNNNPIQRNGNIKVYKLGCGKENENEFLESGEKNPLYQEWCDNS